MAQVKMLARRAVLIVAGLAAFTAASLTAHEAVNAAYSFGRSFSG